MGREPGGARYFATWSCCRQGEAGDHYFSCTGGLVDGRWRPAAVGRGWAVRSTPITARARRRGLRQPGGRVVWQMLSPPLAHPLDYKELSWVQPEDEVLYA